jgi:hypothetical protein
MRPLLKVLLVVVSSKPPEIDGQVHLTDEFDVAPGDLVWGQIMHADEHDMLFTTKSLCN